MNKTVTRTYITTADLADACSDQIALFERTFGDRAEITHANMEKAIAAGLYIGRLRCLIPESARTQYELVEGPAWKEYDKATTPAFLALVHAATMEKRVATPDEYDKITAPVRAKFYRAIAKPLVAALTVAKENV